MEERNERRIKEVLDSIHELVEMALELKAEAQANALQAIYNRAALVVSPQTDDEILRLWDEGEYSEGWAVLALGVPRYIARAMLNDWREKQTAAEPEGVEE